MKWEKNTVHDVRSNKTDITTVKNSRFEGEKVRTNWILQGWQTWTNSHYHSSIPSSTTGRFLEEKQKSHGRAPDDSMFPFHFIEPSEPHQTEQWKCVSQRGIKPPLVSFLIKDQHQPTSRVTVWTRKQDASSCFSGQFELRKSITETLFSKCVWHALVSFLQTSSQPVSLIFLNPTKWIKKKTGSGYRDL